MSKPKHKHTGRREVMLAALARNMALIKRGLEVFVLHKDGRETFLSRSHHAQFVWEDALHALSWGKQVAAGSELPGEAAVQADTTKLKIYSDGGSRGNPGPSASGYVIMTGDESHILERGGRYLGITTNNQAEYQAVKLALESAAKFNPEEIEFGIDSLLVVNQLNGLFKVKSKELWPVHEAIQSLRTGYKKVTFKHVYREFNQLADGEVNKILDAEAQLSKPA